MRTSVVVLAPLSGGRRFRLAKSNAPPCSGGTALGQLGLLAPASTQGGEVLL